MAETQVFDQVKAAGDAIRKPAYVNVFAQDYKPLPGPTARGFKTAIGGAKAAAGGLAAVAGDVAGIESLKQYGLDVAKRASEEAAQYSMPVEQVDSVGSAIDFAKYAVGHTGGNLLTLLAGGALGRTAGAALARGVPAAAEKLLLKNAGMTAGLGASAIGQEIGSIYPDAVESGVPDPAARSIVGGTAAGALDMAPAALLANRLGLFGKAVSAIGPRTAKKVAAGVAKGAAVQAGIEGGTEVAQTAIERVSAGRPLEGDEAFSQFLNAGALGALGGGAFGGVAGGVEAARPGAPAPVPQPLAAAPAGAPSPMGAPVPVTPAEPTPFQAATAEDLALVQEADRLALVDTSPSPATPEELQLIQVRDSRKAAQARLSALDIEEQKPAKQRRAKQAIAKDRAAIRAEIAGLEQRESNLNAIMSGPQYAARGALARPTIIGEQPTAAAPAEIITPEQDAALRVAEQEAADAARQKQIEGSIQQERVSGSEVGTPAQAGAGDSLQRAAEGEVQQAVGAESVQTRLALGKRTRGELLSAEEAAAVRKFEATAPAIVRPAPTSSRGAIKQPGGKQARENFVAAYTTSVDKVVDDLAAQVPMAPARISSLKSALKRAAEKAVQQPDAETAQQVLNDGFAAALKGKLPAQDVEVFSQRLAQEVLASAPPIVSKYFSKAAVTPTDTVVFSHWGTVPGGITDPSKMGTGVRGADWESARAVGLTYTSAVVKGSAYTELDVQTRTPYVGVLAADRVYRADRNDPMLAEARAEIAPQFGPDENIAWAQYAKKVRDLGYDAIQYANGQLRIFTPQAVYRVPDKAVIARAAAEASSLHAKFNGSSYNVVTGQDMGGTLNFAVSPYKGRELVIPGKDVPASVLQKYVQDNADLLTDPRNILGTWYNEADGNSYLDVSVVTASREEAARMAREADQIAFFDLRSFTEIATESEPTGVMSSQAAARFDTIMAHKGEQMLRALESIIGAPTRVTAKIVSQVEGGTGAIRFGQMRDVIEMSIRAKDGTSLAAHEGYHYLEQRVLNRDEKAVISRAFKRGAPTYNALVVRAREYDRVNGTDITSEIVGNPREATAYGYEFWDRGELDATSTLARVWSKIKQVAARVANMVRGHGFQSHEDIFKAIKAGQYARREGQGLGVYAAEPSFSRAAEQRKVTNTPAERAFFKAVWDNLADKLELLENVPSALFDGQDLRVSTADVDGFYQYVEDTVRLREGERLPPSFFSGKIHGTLFSQAATTESLAELAQRVQAGELPRTQLNIRMAEVLDDKTIPNGLKEKLFDGTADEFRAWGGSAKRMLAENILSGQNLSRKSSGYRNVFGVLTSYVQRKNVLIADAVEKRLSTWVTGASKEDKVAVSAALLTRTENGWTTGSEEYLALRSGLNDAQRAMFDQASEMINSRLDAELQAEIPAYRKVLGEEAFNEWYANRYAQVERLKAEGYFPERRFGDHVVHAYVTAPDGKKVTAYFSQHEREADARRELDELNRLAGNEGLTFEYGYRYRAEYDGSISFGQFLTAADRVGVNLTQAEKERIGKALISADSTRRSRVFRRKNIAGYSQDGMRILAEFGVTMANKIAYAELGEAINDAMSGLRVDVAFDNRGQVKVDTLAGSNVWELDGPEAGFYRNIADETVSFVLSPREGSTVSSKLRGAATAHFLGGSIAAGMVNLSSLPMNTVPWLTQHTSYTDAMAKVLGAVKTSAANFNAIRDLPTLMDTTKRLEGIDDTEGLRHALQVAAQDGTILDTEIYQIMGLSRGQEYSMSGAVQKAVQVWMTPFRLAEQMNRMATFIAAYKVAKGNNLDSDAAYTLAQETVYSTQFRYDDANRPALARGDFGSILFVFKSYPIFVLETLSFLAKENPRAAAFMLGSLVMVAGIQGLPFAEDLEDLIDTIAQRLFGSPFNSQRWLRNTLKTASEAVTGTDLSSVFMHGVVNSMTELNFASRVGLGNLIPGTRIGTADADYKSVMTEIIGPTGSLVGGVLGGVDALNRGEFVEAARKALPLGAQNFVKGAQQWNSGFATDIGGRKLVDVSGWEAFWQSFGMSSAAVADAYTADRIDRQTVAYYTAARRAFQADIVKAVKAADAGQIKDATDAVTAWNKTHPDMPMSISPAAVRRAVTQAGMTLNQRTLEKMPKQLRGVSEAALGLDEEE